MLFIFSFWLCIFRLACRKTFETINQIRCLFCTLSPPLPTPPSARKKYRRSRSSNRKPRYVLKPLKPIFQLIQFIYVLLCFVYRCWSWRKEQNSESISTCSTQIVKMLNHKSRFSLIAFWHFPFMTKIDLIFIFIYFHFMHETQRLMNPTIYAHYLLTL